TWLDEAWAAGIENANAMTVASVGADGMPSARMVLLKEADARGFVFFTNFESRKGRELLAAPKAALCFYWSQLGRQVRAQGTVEVVSEAEADAYFATRPRDSRIGAWASAQSRPLDSRETLERKVAEVAARYKGQ